MINTDLKHIRVGVVRASRTIGTHYSRPGSPGRTLCGADLTAVDWLQEDAKKATAEELRRWNVCEECAKRLATNGPCRQCGAPIPEGGTVTCLRSECQEAEYRANALRAQSKRRGRS